MVLVSVAFQRKPRLHPLNDEIQSLASFPEWLELWDDPVAALVDDLPNRFFEFAIAFRPIRIEGRRSLRIEVIREEAVTHIRCVQVRGHNAMKEPNLIACTTCRDIEALFGLTVRESSICRVWCSHHAQEDDVAFVTLKGVGITEGQFALLYFPRLNARHYHFTNSLGLHFAEQRNYPHRLSSIGRVHHTLDEGIDKRSSLYVIPYLGTPPFPHAHRNMSDNYRLQSICRILTQWQQRFVLVA